MATFSSRLLSPGMLSLSQNLPTYRTPRPQSPNKLKSSLAECSEQHSREEKFMGRPDLIKTASDSSL
jgi:hypothetical protein